MPSKIRMSNGVDIPFVGVGTGGKHASDEVTADMLRMALDIGYRHIDTAQMYENEHVVGEVLAEYFSSGKLNREDVFVTTKLPPTANQPSAVEVCLRSELAKLRLDYVDLYLIHSPCSYKPHGDSYEMKMYHGEPIENDNTVDLSETWKAMEHVYKIGLAKSIGLSNFNVEQLQRLYIAAEIKPHNMQLEVHVHWPQKELLTLCQSLNITVTAYGPIGCPGKKGTNGWPEFGPTDEPVVKAIAEKHGKTPAQILLRHLTQRNIIVVPKSTNRERLTENFESSNFFLTDEDVTALNDIEPRKRLYTWSSNKGIMDHVEYPFTELLPNKDE